jgi:hypothetical protein
MKSLKMRASGKPIITSKSATVLGVILFKLFRNRKRHSQLFDGKGLDLGKFQKFFYNFQEKNEFILYDYSFSFQSKGLIIGSEFWNDLTELNNAEWIIMEQSNPYVKTTSIGKDLANRVYIIEEKMRKAINEL